MAWYLQGGKVVMSPTGLIFDNGASISFNYYISATGDDNNPGTLASPWSATGLVNNGATYAGKRVGIIGNTAASPTVYQSGKKGGVVTTLFAISNAGSSSGPAMSAYGGTAASPTYIGCCDSSGNELPRCAVFDASNPVGGALPSAGYGLLGQNYLAVPLANRGNITISGLVVRNCWMNGIAFYPQLQSGGAGGYPWAGSTLNTGIRVQNCEIYNIQGAADSNMGGIYFQQCIGAYVGNNKIHDISGTGNQGNCNGIHTFSCYSNIYELNTIYNVPVGIHNKSQGNGNSNHTIRYNYIELSGTAAISECIADGIASVTGDIETVHHNILYGVTGWNGSTADTSNGGGALIYNNTFIQGGTGGAFSVNLLGATGPVTSYNNLIISQGHVTTGIISVYGPAYTLGAYNTYDDSSHAPNWATTSTNTTPLTPTTYSPLSNWQTAVSTDTTSEVATPTFSGSIGTGTFNASNYQLTGSIGIGTGHVGGTSGGAAINRGAWDGVVTQIGCNFTTTLNFPLLGGVFIAGSVQTSWGTPTFQAQVAKLNLAVIGTYPGWTGGGFTMQSAAAAVKAINPKIKLVPYTNLMELEAGVGSSGSAYSPIFNAATTMNWFLRTTWPAGSITDADGNAQDGLNQTTFTVAGTGTYAGFANYLAWRASWTAANEYPGTPWDGVYLDNVFYQPRVTADYNQSGSGQTASSAATNWRNGYVAYAQQSGYLRAALPAGALVLGNSADWGNGSVVGYSQLFDGPVMEGITTFQTTWVSQLNTYSTCMQNTKFPSYAIYAQDGSTTDYQFMRYGLCQCLLDNAYYYHSNNGNYDTVEIYDEFNFNLGPPIVGPNNLGNGTYSNSELTVWLAQGTHGVWRRDFQNGISIVNPIGNGSQTVVVDAVNNFWHLRGTQANPPNDATEVVAGGTVTLADGDGLILSRSAT